MNTRQPIPTRAILTAVAVLSFVVLITSAMFLATEIFLTLFLGLLFAVFLGRTSRLLEGSLPLSRGLSLALTTSILLLLVVVGLGAFSVKVEQELVNASQHLDQGVEQIREFAEQSSTLRSFLGSTPFLREFVNDNPPDGPNSGRDANNVRSEPILPLDASQNAVAQTAQRAASVLSRIFQTSFGLLVNSALIFFVGLFLASTPLEYREGVVQLFPPARRDRARAVMNDIGETLWQWLLGRFGSMLITGLGAGIILALLGVPMAVALGVTTGLLTFVPNIGAAIALVLAVLVALPQGGMTAMMVVPAYIGLQLIESYIVTPLIQKRQTSLPPALLIAFQAIMGALLGFLGAAVASPLLAALKVIVQQVYVHDILESKADGESTRRVA